MKISTPITALVAAGTATGTAIPRAATSDQLCAGAAYQQDGQSYCRPVQQINYQRAGMSGNYSEVVSMDQETGECQFQTHDFSGPLAPFNEAVSCLHPTNPT
jgi:hypothetical protein